MSLSPQSPFQLSPTIAPTTTSSPGNSPSLLPAAAPQHQTNTRNSNVTTPTSPVQQQIRHTSSGSTIHTEGSASFGATGAASSGSAKKSPHQQQPQQQPSQKTQSKGWRVLQRAQMVSSAFGSNRHRATPHNNASFTAAALAAAAAAAASSTPTSLLPTSPTHQNINTIDVDDEVDAGPGIQDDDDDDDVTSGTSLHRHNMGSGADAFGPGAHASFRLLQQAAQQAASGVGGAMGERDTSNSLGSFADSFVSGTFNAAASGSGRTASLKNLRRNPSGGSASSTNVRASGPAALTSPVRSDNASSYASFRRLPAEHEQEIEHSKRVGGADDGGGKGLASGDEDDDDDDDDDDVQKHGRKKHHDADAGDVEMNEIHPEEAKRKINRPPGLSADAFEQPPSKNTTGAADGADVSPERFEGYINKAERGRKDHYWLVSDALSDGVMMKTFKTADELVAFFRKDKKALLSKMSKRHHKNAGSILSEEVSGGDGGQVPAAETGPSSPTADQEQEQEQQHPTITNLTESYHWLDIQTSDRQAILQIMQLFPFLRRETFKEVCFRDEPFQIFQHFQIQDYYYCQLSCPGHRKRKERDMRLQQLSRVGLLDRERNPSSPASPSTTQQQQQQQQPSSPASPASPSSGDGNDGSPSSSSFQEDEERARLNQEAEIENCCGEYIARCCKSNRTKVSIIVASSLVITIHGEPFKGLGSFLKQVHNQVARPRENLKDFLVALTMSLSPTAAGSPTTMSSQQQDQSSNNNNNNNNNQQERDDDEAEKLRQRAVSIADSFVSVESRRRMSFISPVDGLPSLPGGGGGAAGGAASAPTLMRSSINSASNSSLKQHQNDPHSSDPHHHQQQQQQENNIKRQRRNTTVGGPSSPSSPPGVASAASPADAASAALAASTFAMSQLPAALQVRAPDSLAHSRGIRKAHRMVDATFDMDDAHVPPTQEASASVLSAAAASAQSLATSSPDNAATSTAAPSPTRGGNNNNYVGGPSSPLLSATSPSSLVMMNPNVAAAAAVIPRMSPGWVLASIVQLVVENSIPDLTGASDSVSQVEERIFQTSIEIDDETQVANVENMKLFQDLVSKIGQIRRLTSELYADFIQKAVLLQTILAPRYATHHDLWKKMFSRALLRQATVNLGRSLEQLDSIREHLTQCNTNVQGKISIAQMDASIRMDSQSRRLSQVATICLPMGLLVSLFGCNIPVPFQRDESTNNGFTSTTPFVVMVVIIIVWCVVGIALIYKSKLKEWFLGSED